MPVISVLRDQLFEKLGQTYTDDEFSLFCFEFGIELDDITSEREMAMKETGEASTATDDVIYKIDLPANRYDLLSIEGLITALNIFKGKIKPPVYKAYPPKRELRIKAAPEVASIRPFVVGAVLRNISFNKDNYDSFIKLQDKLHQGIGRKRSLVSIGTHDLDTISGPFTYEALPPKDIRFAPLNETKVYDGQQLMEHLEKNQNLKKFLPIISSSPVYPVIYDSNRLVLSLPPIINGNHSKITLKTTNVFLEVTATDKTKAIIFLQTMIASFSLYCKEQFTVEQVEVEYPNGEIEVHPGVGTYEITASIRNITQGLGLELPSESVTHLLGKMGLESAVSQDDSDKLIISVPITRSDVLHECDVMEDLAIAYGYNNLKREVPKVNTFGSQQPVNKLTDLLRHDLAFAGYYETLSFTLCSRVENYEFLNRGDNKSAVEIETKMLECQSIRTSLLIGLLKTVQHNQKEQLPLKMFEIADVVLLNGESETGASNHRRLAAIYCNVTAGFENIHGLLDQIMVSLNVPYDENHKGVGYHIVKSDDPTFFEGRRVDIIVNNQKIGTFGIIHPKVLSAFEIHFPCSAIEIDVDYFVPIRSH
eukprot:TRINITY_DN12343_c0_g1_i1.p1 TRINITY_DN12343_c0_g1~~TRINITY_DN12343_c0_g1_i1.p1  ORF type:complete len:602 (+),score=106.77 TRINITY_DN12343_c0_g1_i1:28-1806(+)